MSDFRDSYRSSLKDLREAGPSIVIAALLFVAGIGLGSAHPQWSAEGFSAMKEFARHLPDKSMPTLIAAIFLKNVLAAALSVLTGPLWGIISIFAAIVNGLLIGSVFSSVTQTTAVGAVSLTLSLIPHGIFELPAICTAWGLGIWQGIWFLQRNKTGTLRERRKKAIRILLLIIVPLLFVAAIIEGTGIAVRAAG